jgi:hypothetical protein
MPFAPPAGRPCCRDSTIVILIPQFAAQGQAAFKQVLDRARIPATVRLTRGRDIAAACGQLATAR